MPSNGALGGLWGRVRTEARRELLVVDVKLPTCARSLSVWSVSPVGDDAPPVTGKAPALRVMWRARNVPTFGWLCLGDQLGAVQWRASSSSCIIDGRSSSASDDGTTEPELWTPHAPHACGLHRRRVRRAGSCASRRPCAPRRPDLILRLLRGCSDVGAPDWIWRTVPARSRVSGQGHRRRRRWLVTLTPRTRAYRMPSDWTEGMRSSTRSSRDSHHDDMYRASDYGSEG